MNFFSILTTLLSLIFFSCSESVNSNTANEINKNASQIKKDTLIEEVHCSIVMNGKKFTIKPDDINADYSLADSSLNLTFKKIESGFIVLHIPKIFKCPCTVPTGYSPTTTNISFTQDRILLPTLTLENYPLQGISFQNLNDGFNAKKIEDGAATIFIMNPTGAGSTSTGYEYLIKGKIHTTALKSVYESNAGEKNKDYRIEGSFVIKKIIYT